MKNMMTRLTLLAALTGVPQFGVVATTWAAEGRDAKAERPGRSEPRPEQRPGQMAPQPEQMGRQMGAQMERFEQRLNQLAERQEQFMRQMGERRERMGMAAQAGHPGLRQAMPPPPPGPLPPPQMGPPPQPQMGPRPMMSPAGVPPMAHHLKAIGDMMGLFLICYAVCNILMAIWIFTDIRKRGEGPAIFVAMALIAGIPAALIYSLVRIGDKRAASP